MLGELLRQLGTGRALPFLLAGLLPAFVLIAGVGWYEGGLAAVLGATARIARPAEVSLYLLLLLGTALAFYAARGPVLYFFQTVPAPPVPARLRDRLVRRQIARARRAARALHGAEAEFAPFFWIGLRDAENAPGDETRAYIDEKTWFAELPKPPRWLERIADPSPLEARRKSREAREVLSGLAASVEGSAEPSPRELRRVCEGLLQLRLLAANPVRRRDAQAEIGAWKVFLRSVPEAVPMLVRLRHAVQRRVTQGYLRYRMYPDEQWMQPTMLGNRLAALDDYSAKRYGIDTSALLVRLWGVATAEERAGVTDAQLRVEVLVTMSVALAGLATAIAIRWIWSTRLQFPQPYGADWRTVGAVLAAGALSVMAYRGAVTAFGAVEERLQRLVDLKRLAVLKAFGYKAPATVAEEQELFDELNRFFTMAGRREPSRLLRSDAV